MLKIWGRITSINVQKVVWCADEIGLAYERVDAGGAFGLTKTPEYIAMNPNSLVPTIEDDGFVLYESNAIVRYLCAKHPKAGLWPEDLRERADVDRWMEWLSTTLVPATRDAFWNLIRMAPEQRDNAAIEKSREASERYFAILDGHLAKNRYLTPSFSAADIVTGCAAHRWLNLPIKREPRPHVERWYAELKSRPGSRHVTSLVLA
jgi:glutathione S-transferase